jgi:hypothetical protein
MPKRRIRARHLLLTVAVVALSLWLLVPGGALVGAQALTPMYLPLLWNEPIPTPNLGWRLEYYNDVTPTGSPVYTTYEQTKFIEKEWGEGGPGNGVNADYFSARFTRDIWFEPGTYQFVLTADDGGRLYIDGSNVLDMWSGSPRGTHSSVHEHTFSTAGYHEIKIEYVEWFGGARVRAFWTNKAEFPGWRAEYWNNEWMSGDPVVVRNEESLQLNWGSSSPSGVPYDYFSARFTRAVYLPDYGSYVFFLTADDGGQVWLDKWAPGQASIDKYSGASGQTTSTHEILPPGWYVITVTFHEVVGEARLDFRYAFGGTYNEFGYRGKYYNNANLSEPPIWEQDDAMASPPTKDTSGRITSEKLAFSWGSGAPSLHSETGATPPTMPSDNFSVSWTHAFRGQPGTYLFTTKADDGFRLFVDGQLIREDSWWASPGQQFTNSVVLGGEWHTIRLDYREVEKDAYVEFRWARQ